MDGCTLTVTDATAAKGFGKVGIVPQPCFKTTSLKI
jgi:hypothetical protein